MGGGGGLLGGIFGGKGGGGSQQSGYTNIDIDTEKTTNPFSSEESRKNYNAYVNASKAGYQNALNYQPEILKGVQGLNNQIAQYQKKGGVGDTSYFKQAWNQAQGIDQKNLNKLNTQSWNPNDNADWVKANDQIDANARLGWGQYNNQLMQNMIGSNMANGSGHQTAAAKQSMMLNSQLAADRANRWQQQYNQNAQNTLAANNQLGNFYTTLSNLGIDYARLSQQDLSTLLNAYQTQADLYNTALSGANNALQTWGQAVAMGSDPKETSHQHKEGQESSTTQNQQSAGEGFGNLMSAIGTGMMIFCFVGDTPIFTPNGEVEIKDIKVGDKVYALDSNNNDEIIVAEVTETLEPKESEVVLVQVGDRDVWTTPSQPFLTKDEEFVTIDDMIIGETELKQFGKVTNIIPIPDKELVYDLKISRGDCYFANGLVVKAATNEW